jgi:hypothetical protein
MSYDRVVFCELQKLRLKWYRAGLLLLYNPSTLDKKNV